MIITKSLSMINSIWLTWWVFTWRHYNLAMLSLQMFPCIESSKHWWLTSYCFLCALGLPGLLRLWKCCILYNKSILSLLMLFFLAFGPFRPITALSPAGNRKFFSIDAWRPSFGWYRIHRVNNMFLYLYNIALNSSLSCYNRNKLFFIIESSTVGYKLI